MDTDNRELFEKDKIIEVLEAYFGKDRVFVVTTKEYDLTINPSSRNSVKSRSEWADFVVKQLYNSDRGKLDDDDKTIQFSFSQEDYFLNETTMFYVSFHDKLDLFKEGFAEFKFKDDILLFSFLLLICDKFSFSVSFSFCSSIILN